MVVCLCVDQDARAAAADALGVGVDDLDFGDLTYFEGEKFTISNEFADVAASGAEKKTRPSRRSLGSSGGRLGTRTDVLRTTVVTGFRVVLYGIAF